MLKQMDINTKEVQEKVGEKHRHKNQQIVVVDVYNKEPTFVDILLQVTFRKCNHGGNSRRSERTVSSNSKFVNSPSPLKNFKLREFGSRFFANLKKIF